MVEELVSIIVLVYNVEDFIGKCVESLLKQTYRNIEIILVDDGSYDHSVEIIDKFARMDQRVHAIHQLNKGVSAARNAGLEISSGEYIMFVDGDDWVDADYVSYFLTLIKKTKTLMVMNKNNYTTSGFKTRDMDYVVSAEKAIEWIYSEDICVAVWNKMYNRELLCENKICFNPQIWYGEGMLFNIQCLQFVDTVAVGEKSVYHQRFNLNSATRKFNLDSNLCGIKSLDMQKSIWKKDTLAIERAWEYHKYRFNKSIVCGLIKSDMVSEYSDLYSTCLKQLRKGIMMPLKMEKTLKAKVGWLLYYICPELMAKRSLYIQKIILAKIRGGGQLGHNRLLTVMRIPINVQRIGGCA